MAGLYGANIVIGIIKFFAFIIDLFTFPIYFLVQQPWRKRSLMRRQRAEQVGSGDNEVTYRSIAKKHELCKEAEEKGVDTVEKMFNFLHSKYATKPCIGTRQIFSVEEEKSDETGKVLKKYNMGKYHWITYDEMFNRALEFCL